MDMQDKVEQGIMVQENKVNLSNDEYRKNALEELNQMFREAKELKAEIEQIRQTVKYLRTESDQRQEELMSMRGAMVDATDDIDELKAFIRRFV